MIICFLLGHISCLVTLYRRDGNKICLCLCREERKHSTIGKNCDSNVDRTSEKTGEISCEQSVHGGNSQC